MTASIMLSTAVQNNFLHSMSSQQAAPTALSRRSFVNVTDGSSHRHIWGSHHIRFSPKRTLAKIGFHNVTFIGRVKNLNLVLNRRLLHRRLLRRRPDTIRPVFTWLSCLLGTRCSTVDG